MAKNPEKPAVPMAADSPLPTAPAKVTIPAPVAAPTAPTVARVAITLPNRAPGVPVAVGDTLMAHGVTFRSPVTGTVCTTLGLDTGWPACPKGSRAIIVPGTRLNPATGRNESAVVVVTEQLATSGRTGPGGRSGCWKAWPYTDHAMRMVAQETH